MAQRPELLIKKPVYSQAWDDSHYGRMAAPMYQATIDRNGVAPFAGPCENPITVVAEVPIIDELKQFHPSTTVQLSRPLTPGKRYYVDFEASVLPKPHTLHPTTYYNYWPQIFPTTKQAPTEIFGTWRYMVTQTHWRTEYGQFLSRKIKPGEPITFSEPEPLQLAIWPLEDINYLTFVFTSLGQNAFLHVPVNDTVAVTNIRICPCEAGPVLVYNLGIPSTPHNLKELKKVGLTTLKAEADTSISCGTVLEESVVNYVTPALPMDDVNLPEVQDTKLVEVAQVPTVDKQNTSKTKDPIPQKTTVPERLKPTSPLAPLTNKSDQLVIPAQSTLAALPKATSRQLRRAPKKEGQLIKLENGAFRLGLRDHKLIDGDIVTILVNGHILVEAYELTAKIKWFDLPLLAGDNQIILFAENLGRRVPNTAAITLESGSDRQEVILQSDLEESAFFVVRVE